MALFLVKKKEKKVETEEKLLGKKSGKGFRMKVG